MSVASLAAALERRNVHYGWVMVGATLLVTVITAAAMSTPGVLIVPLEQEYGWTDAQISTALAIRLMHEMRAKAAAGEGKGFGTLMGPRASERGANVNTSVEGGLIAPIENVSGMEIMWVRSQRHSASSALVVFFASG